MARRSFGMAATMASTSPHMASAYRGSIASWSSVRTKPATTSSGPGRLTWNRQCQERRLTPDPEPTEADLAVRDAPEPAAQDAGRGAEDVLDAVQGHAPDEVHTLDGAHDTTTPNR